MPTYRVKSNIGKDHKEYVAGDTITLTEEEAAAMPWAVESMEVKFAEVPMKMETHKLTEKEVSPIPSAPAPKSEPEKPTKPKRK